MSPEAVNFLKGILWIVGGTSAVLFAVAVAYGIKAFRAVQREEEYLARKRSEDQSKS